MAKKKIIKTYNQYNLGGPFWSALTGKSFEGTGKATDKDGNEIFTLTPQEVKAQKWGNAGATGLKTLAPAAGALGNKLISDGLTSGAGSAITNIGGMAGSAISTVNPLLGAAVTVGSNILGGVTNKLFGSKRNEANIADIRASTADMLNTQVDGDEDQIAAQLAQQSFGKTYSANDLIKTGVLKGTSSAAKSMIRDQEMARQSLKNTYNNAFENAAENELLSSLRVMAAGGPLHNHGAMWDNGVIDIQEGGTHDENPYEGVRMGVDAEGTPNLVEEGEIIFNDYVFSNRLLADGGLLDLVHLPHKYNKKTYADIARILSKESEERPNDPYSKKGLVDSMTKLQMAQEVTRQNNQMKEYKKKYAKGGNLYGEGSELNLNYWDNNINWEDLYKENSDFMNKRQAYIDNWDKPHFALQKQRYLNNLKQHNPNLDLSKIDLNTFKRITQDKKWGAAHMLEPIWSLYPDSFIEEAGQFTPPNIKANVSINPRGAKTNTMPSNTNNDLIFKDNNDSSPMDLRMMAPYTEIGLLTNNLLSNPDYTYSDMLQNVANRANNYERIYAPKVSNYMTFKPTDTNRIANRLMASNNAAIRNIVNLGEGNRGAINANIAAANYANQLGLADAFIKADDADYNRLLGVETFNRATNQANAEMALKAAVANQEAGIKASQLMSTLEGQAIGARMKVDDDRRVAINQGITNILDNFGEISREKFARNQLDMLIESGYYPTITTKPAHWSKARWNRYKLNAKKRGGE